MRAWLAIVGCALCAVAAGCGGAGDGADAPVGVEQLVQRCRFTAAAPAAAALVPMTVHELRDTALQAPAPGAADPDLLENWAQLTPLPRESQGLGAASGYSPLLQVRIRDDDDDDGDERDPFGLGDSWSDSEVSWGWLADGVLELDRERTEPREAYGGWSPDDWLGTSGRRERRSGAWTLPEDPTAPPDSSSGVPEFNALQDWGAGR